MAISCMIIVQTPFQKNQLEKVQREAALCITRAQRCTSHKNLLTEVGLTTLKERRGRQKLLFIYKCLNNLTPDYLASVITSRRITIQHETRHPNDLLPYNSNKCYLYNSFIVSSIREWNLASRHLKDSPTLNTLRKCLLIKDNFNNKINLLGNSFGHINLSRIRMGLSGLNFHRHKFHFISTSICPTCGISAETPVHYFFYCPTYAALRQQMFDELRLILPQHLNELLVSDPNMMLNILLHKNKETLSISKQIDIVVSKYIMASQRF